MIIRDNQMKALESLREASYAKSAAEHLSRFDPVLAQSAGNERLELTARNGLAAARRHDLAEGPALQLYLETMLSLGSGFDDDPQYSWLAPFLDPRQDTSSLERARFLHFHTSAYVLRAYGANKEYARQAAERAQEQLARFVSPQAAHEIPPAELLKWLHPQRLDFVDSGAAAKLSGEARSSAAAAGLPAPQGTNVMLILMFLFGYKVASDPLYPWVESSLKASKPGPDRLNQLVEGTRKHLAAILNGLPKEESK